MTMTKLGRKPLSPNGEAKKRYTVALPTDVIALLRELPNAAAVIESVLRKYFSDADAEEPRDFGSALPFDNGVRCVKDDSLEVNPETGEIYLREGDTGMLRRF